MFPLFNAVVGTFVVFPHSHRHCHRRFCFARGALEHHESTEPQPGQVFVRNECLTPMSGHRPGGACLCEREARAVVTTVNAATSARIPTSVGLRAIRVTHSRGNTTECGHIKVRASSAPVAGTSQGTPATSTDGGRERAGSWGAGDLGLVGMPTWGSRSIALHARRVELQQQGSDSKWAASPTSPLPFLMKGKRP